MSDVFIPIATFKEKFGVDFTTAYEWRTEEIIQFLEKVSQNPANYKAPVNRKSDFVALYNDIAKLRKVGEMYAKPTPPQQLLRTSRDIAPSKKYSWGDAPSTEHEFFIIFDLLGIFLSLMGAPTSTDSKPLTVKNYSLPLVFLYGNWCYELAAEENLQPSVVQITWGTSADEKTFYPFLGASCAGFAHTNVWKTKAQDKRWEYINTILQPPYKDKPYSAPLRNAEDFKASAQRYGNCAETYPFLYILSVPAYVHKCYGIAVDVGAIAVQDSAYSKEQAEKNWDEPMGILIPPCKNCFQILDWYHLTETEKKRFKQFME